MEEVLIQSTLFPPIQQISWIMRAKKVIIEQFDTYSKQTYRNRFQIVGPNGLQNLSIPVEKPFGSETKMKDVKISYSIDWQNQIYRSIRTAYRNSPFYEFYIDDFMFCFTEKHDKLIELNTAVLETVLEILEIDVKIKPSTQFNKNHPHDFRDIVHPKPQYKKTDYLYRNIAYHQLFAEKFDFIPNLSIIDLIFNEGPLSYLYLKKTIVNEKLSK